MTSETTLDAIRDGGDAVFQHYLPELRRAGASLKARCPFHAERTPSFSIRGGRYYCFGCGERGDVFAFVQKVERCDFPAAVILAANITGVVVNQTDGRQTLESARLRNARDRFHGWSESAIVRVARDLRTRDLIIRHLQTAVDSGALNEEHAVNFLARGYAGYSELEHVFGLLLRGDERALEDYFNG